MPTLTQAAKLMAAAYGHPEAEVNKVRQALVSNGQLPASVGRDIPLATPDRTALLFLGLGVADPERIAELADLRRFMEKPGDMDGSYTMGDVLSATISGLQKDPEVGVDMSLTVTTQGMPFGVLVGAGTTLMQFGEPYTIAPVIHHTVTLDMRPLNHFSDAARAVQPPFGAR